MVRTFLIIFGIATLINFTVGISEASTPQASQTVSTKPNSTKDQHPVAKAAQHAETKPSEVNVQPPDARSYNFNLQACPIVSCEKRSSEDECSWPKIILRLIPAFSWPIVAIILSLFFADEVRALLRRIKKAGPDGVELYPATAEQNLAYRKEEIKRDTHGDFDKREIARRDFLRKQVVARLSSILGIPFTSDVLFPSRRTLSQVVFDAYALFKGGLHVVEVKFVRYEQELEVMMVSFDPLMLALQELDIKARDAGKVFKLHLAIVSETENFKMGRGMWEQRLRDRVNGFGLTADVFLFDKHRIEDFG